MPGGGTGNRRRCGASGKGGVGRSTISLNLALPLRDRGLEVGRRMVDMLRSAGVRVLGSVENMERSSTRTAVSP
jgi:ATP-binding protein involved in chromosome partitioning